ncbi:uncharacterized protein LOC132548506 [Ylistrum balloti]|uniref:uncharacterized protein LOC132548506 n=1 Tax=Ylistrum balloti TaxID=509963 RepID=UPI002905DC56|nr:uncharacterized protein LOC132548506 [Ylistrum balloti]
MNMKKLVSKLWHQIRRKIKKGNSHRPDEIVASPEIHPTEFTDSLHSQPNAYDNSELTSDSSQHARQSANTHHEEFPEEFSQLDLSGSSLSLSSLYEEKLEPTSSWLDVTIVNGSQLSSSFMSLSLIDSETFSSQENHYLSPSESRFLNYHFLPSCSTTDLFPSRTSFAIEALDLAQHSSTSCFHIRQDGESVSGRVCVNPRPQEIIISRRDLTGTQASSAVLEETPVCPDEILDGRNSTEDIVENIGQECQPRQACSGRPGGKPETSGSRVLCSRYQQTEQHPVNGAQLILDQTEQNTDHDAQLIPDQTEQNTDHDAQLIPDQTEENTDHDAQLIPDQTEQHPVNGAQLILDQTEQNTDHDAQLIPDQTEQNTDHDSQLVPDQPEENTDHDSQLVPDRTEQNTDHDSQLVPDQPEENTDHDSQLVPDRTEQNTDHDAQLILDQTEQHPVNGAQLILDQTEQNTDHDAQLIPDQTEENTDHDAQLIPDQTEQNTDHDSQLVSDQPEENTDHDSQQVPDRTEQNTDHDVQLVPDQTKQNTDHDAQLIPDQTEQNTDHDSQLVPDRTEQNTDHDSQLVSDRTEQNTDHDSQLVPDQTEQNTNHDVQLVPDQTKQNTDHDAQLIPDQTEQNTDHDSQLVPDRTEQNTDHDSQLVSDRTEQNTDHDSQLVPDQTEQNTDHDVQLVPDQTKQNTDHDAKLVPKLLEHQADRGFQRVLGKTDPHAGQTGKGELEYTADFQKLLPSAGGCWKIKERSIKMICTCQISCILFTTFMLLKLHPRMEYVLLHSHYKCLYNVAKMCLEGKNDEAKMFLWTKHGKPLPKDYKLDFRTELEADWILKVLDIKVFEKISSCTNEACTVDKGGTEIEKKFQDSIKEISKRFMNKPFVSWQELITDWSDEIMSCPECNNGNIHVTRRLDKDPPPLLPFQTFFEESENSSVQEEVTLNTSAPPEGDHSTPRPSEIFTIRSKNHTREIPFPVRLDGDEQPEEFVIGTHRYKLHAVSYAILKQSTGKAYLHERSKVWDDVLAQWMYFDEEGWGISDYKMKMSVDTTQDKSYRVAYFRLLSV